MNNKSKAISKAILNCVLFTFVLALVSFVKHIFPLQYERYAYGIIGMIVALAVTKLFLTIDKKNFVNIGLQWQPSTIKKFLTGFFSGLLLAGIMMATVIYTNGFKLVQVTASGIPLFFVWAMSLLLLSWMEEIAFRTYAMNTIQKAAGIWVAQFIVAILFALYHIAGGQPVLISLLGPGIWSFIFGWAVLRSGGIAMATGIHFSVNLFQAAISQKKQYTGIWKIEPAGELTTAIQKQTDITGMLVQLALLILALILTWSISKKKLVN